MFSDSALLFWTFVTLAATFAVGAYSLTGAKARNLWIAAAGCLVLAFVLGFGFPSFAARYAATALKAVWILYPLLTVSVVALLVRDLRAPNGAGTGFDLSGLQQPEIPPFAVISNTKWKPDITFRQGIGYLGAKSNWRDPYGRRDIDTACSTITGALSANKITAWGREHPGEGELFEIRETFWRSTEVNHDTNYVYSASVGIGAYDVHLCQKEMEQVWTPKADPASA